MARTRLTHGRVRSPNPSNLHELVGHERTWSRELVEEGCNEVSHTKKVLRTRVTSTFRRKISARLYGPGIALLAILQPKSSGP